MGVNFGFEQIKPRAEPRGTQSAKPLRLRGAGAEIVSREEWLEGLFACVADGILVHDRDGRFLEVNPAACKLLGYAREELLAMTAWQVVANGSRPEMLRLWRRTRRGEAVAVERTYRRKDGRLVVADVRLTRFASGGRDLILLSCRDITEGKRLEDKLRASEQLARGQVEALTQTLDALAEESALDKLLGHVLAVLSRQMEAQGVSLWLRDRATGLPVFHLSFKAGRIATQPDADHPVVENPAYWEENPMGQEMLRLKRAVVCEDVEHDPRLAPYRDYLMAQEIRTLLAVPLLVAGRVIGLLSVRCGSRRPYRAEEIELAQALAHQATLAIELTRLAEQSRQAAVLEERNRMARDIHDTLAQGFTGIIVQLEAAEDAILTESTKEARKHLLRAGQLARQSLGEARRSMRALRPQVLGHGSLLAALERLLKQMTPGSGLQATISLAGKPRSLRPEWEENLLRIGQEALTNALKHAQASRFDLRLVFHPKQVLLELRDNGRGFNTANGNRGLGLTGMQERVERMGGRLAIQSSPGRGTGISVILPHDPTFVAQAP